jgi:spore coat polysaccharide biosynthesis protein SpsF
MSENIVIVQARMGSSRLPGKSMMLIGEKPMLDYLIDTLLVVFNKKEIHLATSINAENNVIREYAKQKGIACFSGDENNVASRYFQILESHKEKKILFRICGDSPYYDPEILRKGLKLMNDNEMDFVSSMPNKGYPMGCNLEVIKTNLYLNAYSKFCLQSQFEHVMPYFYDNIEQFKYSLIECEEPEYSYDKYKFSVDTIEDFNTAQLMIEKMNFVPWKYSLKMKLQLQDKFKNICL